jgi:hypothetical protein
MVTVVRLESPRIGSVKKGTSPEQSLADWLTRTPADDEARLALATVLVERGQLGYAHKLLENVPNTAHEKLRALRDRVRRAPAPLAGLPVAKAGPSWRRSGCATALAVAALGCLLVGALTIPFWVSSAALTKEYRRTLRLLESPELHLRLDAAERLGRLFQDDRPQDVGAAIGRALETAPLSEDDALRALSILGDWRQDRTMARYLEHDSRRVRLDAAGHCVNRGQSQFDVPIDAFVRAALHYPDVAERLISWIVAAERPEDVAAIIELSDSNSSEVRSATVDTLLRQFSHSPPTDIRLLEIALRPLDRTEPGPPYRRAMAIEVGLKYADLRALVLFVEETRACAPLTPLEALRRARQITAYPRSKLEALAASETDKSVQGMFRDAITMKRRETR